MKRSNAARRPTLLDVAREASVGTTTVSRVLNGARYVDSETLSRVQSAMKRLGYQPNNAARALKGERSHSIGILIPTLLDPFFANLASGIQMVARSKKYIAIVLTSQDEAEEYALGLQTFQSFRVDGLVVVPPRQQSKSFTRALQSLDVPTVAVDRPLLGTYSVVTCNNTEASREAVLHLIQHDRKRILCFGGDPAISTIQDRIQGYKEAIESAGLQPIIEPCYDLEEMKSILRSRFAHSKTQPDAIFATYNNACIAAYEFLTDSHLKPAVDVALLGFDDFLLAGALRPAVSVVRQPIDDLAHSAAELLFAQIDSSSRAPRQIIVRAALAFRASCGCDYCPNSGSKGALS